MRNLFFVMLCLAVCLPCVGCKEQSSTEESVNQAENVPSPETVEPDDVEEPVIEPAIEVETMGKAPTFVALDLDENTIDLAEEAQDVDYVLLDFWASWCGPCRVEFPYLRSIQEQHKDHSLRIIGVSLDTDRAAAVAAAEENGLDYPHIFDGGRWQNAVAVQYEVRSIPATILLDSDLNIVAKGLRGAELEAKLTELLGPADE